MATKARIRLCRPPLSVSWRVRAPCERPCSAWLPTQRVPNGDGFAAEWKVASFSRGFPQSWTTRQVAVADVVKQLDAATFGVRFARGLDSYGTVERALKYGVLFIALVFAVFFLFEIVAELRIHPLQYAMVGAALCLFFLAFLALSEFWAVALAYGVAAAACTSLISFYSWTFLRSGARTLIVSVGLTATYAYLFFVLQSQRSFAIPEMWAGILLLGLLGYALNLIFLLVERRVLAWHRGARASALG